jgi:hypothetical protein
MRLLRPLTLLALASPAFVLADGLAADLSALLQQKVASQLDAAQTQSWGVPPLQVNACCLAAFDLCMGGSTELHRARAVLNSAKKQCGQVPFAGTTKNSICTFFSDPVNCGFTDVPDAVIQSALTSCCSSGLLMCACNGCKTYSALLLDAQKQCLGFYQREANDICNFVSDGNNCGE